MTLESNPLAAPPSTKRTFGARALVLVALFSAVVGAALTTLVMVRLTATEALSAAADEEMATIYQCPMHPTVVQDHPGNCPICGMKLVKVQKSSPEAEATKPGERKIAYYRSPMNTKQTSPGPAKDEMGMDYIPVYEDEVADLPMVAGFATVDIDPARQQLIGLRTSEVVEDLVGGAWRTVGRVAIDETRVRHINLKVPGFVERIYVDFVGKSVKRGDPLFSLYSPELLAAQEELILALHTQSALGKVGEGIKNDGELLVASARRKLSLWDVPKAEIDRIARTGEPTKTLTFYSPVAGVVTMKDVVEGMRLDAGAMPYEIVDLSAVWLLADVYESELRFVKQDMKANLHLNAYPNREFQGKVVFIDPLLDPATRTVKVRLTFPNPTGELRPGMFGEVVLQGTPRKAARIPLDAVIDSGTEKLVFVAVGAGKFEPRRVQLGANDGVNAEVVEGVAVGQRVVTRANFLIDSESRLRASLAEMTTNAPESARVVPLGASPLAPPSATIVEPPGAPPRSPQGPSGAPETHQGHAP